MSDVSTIKDDQFPFADHAIKFKKELTKLERLRLPEPLIWRIDWKELERITNKDSKADKIWSSVPIFKILRENRQLPATYFFGITEAEGKRLFDIFCNLKSASSTLRINNGLKKPEFRNICHVPSVFTESECLYAGSVRKNLHSRLTQHLGYKKSGRTGALYLKEVLPHFKKHPTITFTAYFFEKEYANLTEHIEFVFQTKLNPILGKRSLKEFITVG